MRKHSLVKAVFLDRDGVLNEDPGDAYYVKKWQNFRFIPGVIQALESLSRNDFTIFVVSNQSGVARGEVSQKNLSDLTKRMLDELCKAGVTLAGVFYCLHDEPEACACRKPKTGLYHEAAQGKNIQIAKSYNIGDSERDIQAGNDFGLTSILVLTGKTRTEDVERWRARPAVVKASLSEAVEWILSQSGS